MEVSIKETAGFLFNPEAGVKFLLFMITVQVGFICQYIVKIDFKIRMLVDRRKINNPEEHENTDIYDKF